MKSCPAIIISFVFSVTGSIGRRCLMHVLSNYYVIMKVLLGLNGYFIIIIIIIIIIIGVRGGAVG